MSGRLDRLRKMRLYLLDMDGTIYIGKKRISGALELLKLLKKQKKSYMFFTNNSSRSARDYLKKLRRLGLPAQEEQIVTSGQATIEYIKRRTGYERIYLLGTPSLKREFAGSGLKVVGRNPDCVVLGFDKTLTYEKLRRACRLLQDGIPYISTHPDIVCPDEDGPIPDAGSMQLMIQAATGRMPDKIIGKPNKLMIEMALARAGVGRSAVAMVGDRLYTDMEMARRAGVLSVLVLSGETKRRDLEKYAHKPEYVFDSAGKLAGALSG